MTDDLVERVTAAIESVELRDGTLADMARAAIDAFHPGLLAGTHVVMPVEPTDAIRLAGVGGWNGVYPDHMDKLSEHQQSEATREAWGRAYKAMLSAAQEDTR